MKVERTSTRAGLAGLVLVAGLVYYALAVAMWQVDSTWGSAFWPAAGVTFALLSRTSTRTWPAIFVAVAIAEIAADLQFGTSLTTAAWGALANCTEPLIGAWLFRHAVSGSRVKDMRSLGWFLITGAVAGPAVGAAIGGILAVHGPAAVIVRWLRWMVGDAVGVVAVAPLLLPKSTWRVARSRTEIASVGAILIAVSALLLFSTGALAAASPYLSVPILLWAAVRFNVFWAAACTTCIATVVHVSTATGHGAFVLHDQNGLVVAQTYIGMVAVSVLALAILVESVADHRRTELDLLQRALHDPLTALPNRAMLDQFVMDNQIEAVLTVDLDGFKSINDRFGHAAGDIVLRAIADRLRATCREGDFVARLGGDEFIVIIRTSKSERDVESLRDRLEVVLSEAVDILGGTAAVGASIGLAFSSSAADANALLIEADRDMYLRKSRAYASRASVHGTPQSPVTG
jgi:diguanylate cyclase (GGDEF)-like protein